MKLSTFQLRQLTLMRQLETRAASGTATSAFVSMQQDYVNDPRLCLTIVSFLSPKLQESIDDNLIKPLRALEPDFYYFPRESLHITIQNIRTVADPPLYTAADIATADRLLAGFLNRHRGTFTFQLRGTIKFPTSAAIIALIEPAYDAFVKQLRTELAAAGIPDNKTYFTDEMVFANCTFCRYTHAPSEKFLKRLEGFADTNLGEFTAEKMTLIQTNAGCHPSKTKFFL